MSRASCGRSPAPGPRPTARPTRRGRGGTSGRRRSCRRRTRGSSSPISDRVARRVALGVLGAVDEPEQVALVERPEAVHLVDHRAQPAAAGRSAAARARSTGRSGARGCETADRPGSTGRCAARLGAPERVQSGRPGRAEQPIPDPRAEARDARQLALRDPEADRALQPGHVRERRRGPRPRAPGSTVIVRKIAASVSGVRIGWGSSGIALRARSLSMIRSPTRRARRPVCMTFDKARPRSSGHWRYAQFH